MKWRKSQFIRSGSRHPCCLPVSTHPLLQHPPPSVSVSIEESIVSSIACTNKSTTLDNTAKKVKWHIKKKKKLNRIRIKNSNTSNNVKSTSMCVFLFTCKLYQGIIWGSRLLFLVTTYSCRTEWFRASFSIFTLVFPQTQAKYSLSGAKRWRITGTLHDLPRSLCLASRLMLDTSV